MPDRPITARVLLVAAAAAYDTPEHGLEAAARRAVSGGFRGGGEWMRGAIAVIRGGCPPPAPVGFHGLGVAKYALASAAALAVLVPAVALHDWWLLPFAVLAFYLVEVRMVFAFPLAIDGDPAPIASSHRLVARHHGALAATWTVMQLAAVMLFGGLLRRGFLRSWCQGCLAVTIWYEDLRAAEARA